MTEGQVLEFTRVTKRFNEVTAVSDFSARIEPGAVTAFLGPNGAGKTTTLRMLLGQLRPSSGTATIGGAAYGDLRQPLRTIGAVLEETVYRPRRTASRQLTIAAKANDIPLSRVNEVLALVGLENEGESRIGGFSLGMRQRLSVAHALLGDPGALVFDEPANGLDPEGIRWMRLLMRRLADEGRTVLVSSHVLSEVEQVADNVLVLSKGQLVLASGMEELADPSAGAVTVDADDRSALTAALATAGFDIEILRSGLTVRGSDARRVGEVAADAGIALTTLVQRGPTLEDVFIQLTRGGKLEPHAGLAATNLVAARPALDAAPVAAPVVAEPVDAATVAEPVNAEPVADAEAAAASAIAADVAGAVPGGPIAAAVVAAGAGNAVAHDADASEAAYTGEDADAPDADAPDAVDDAPETNVFADSSDTAPTSIVTPAPSFDDILFGAAPVEETPSAFPAADAAADEQPVENDDHEQRAEEAHTEETHAEEAHSEASDVASIDEASDDVAGVEVFDALAATGTIDAMTHEGSFDDAANGDAPTEGAAEGDDDPRAAAVSSMLADAARTYFEDEPKDYPFGPPTAEAPAENVEADAEHIEAEHIEISPSDVNLDGEDVQTHVIEIIDATPLSASDDDAANADEHDAADPDEHNAETHEHHEHHDGDHHHGDHHHG